MKGKILVAVLLLLGWSGIAVQGGPEGRSAAGPASGPVLVAQYEQSGTDTSSSGEALDRFEIEKRKARSRFRYLMLGYGLIWVGLGTYLFQMNRKIERVGREIHDLKGRLEDSGRPAAR